MRIFIFGAGYSARAFAREVRGTAEWIGGTTRSADKGPLLEDAGVTPFLFDGETLSAEIGEVLHEVTHLVVSAGPDAAGDPVLAVARGAIAAMPKLEWVGYLSTVGVYGDHGGAWIDEESECRPTLPRAIARIGAEGEWGALGALGGVPVATLRLSGIYGPGRNAFANLERDRARRIVKPGQVFNRIHVADIAGALAFLAERREGGVFNVTDDMPAPPQDVIEFAAELMGVEPPPEIPFEEADLSPMARSFYGDVKRVSNARIKRLGYTIRYPDYRSGLEALWQSGNWRTQS